MIVLQDAITKPSSLTAYYASTNFCSGGIAHSVRAPNSNHKVAILMPTLDITRCCVLGKNGLRFQSHNGAKQSNHRAGPV